eukprot:CAMPEP_0196655054 /NCGR_PEP_ID=MMETSP1086-20130531/4808_1 /TAXON_ID=77921 /ORGANISM="Cyanoptyche  gloeocystis , Strain SAG4.97" /LENGTH=72 /DNA_ID=CAMNT_0041987157 /DNA_START=179 /DNA_END=398 /DNA_ORIENTATION=-
MTSAGVVLDYVCYSVLINICGKAGLVSKPPPSAPITRVVVCVIEQAATECQVGPEIGGDANDGDLQRMVDEE